VPSPATDAICSAARQAGAYVIIGINEKVPGTMGSIYNSQLFVSPQGEVIGVHRKLVPTLTERLIHHSGDGSSLRVYDSPHGGIGGLICGENTNSLARFALLAQHERIHVASWPAFSASYQRNSHEAIDIRVKYHAFEGRVFIISTAAVLSDENIRTLGLTEEQVGTLFSRGGHSGIVGPNGSYIAGPADDTEQILYADADMEQIIDGKLSHDLTGHYNRFDIFTLEVKPAPREALRIKVSD
jgi:nitrilase